ncbi:hypothetical protein [Tenacibaculum aquimarinum]|uniref:hypothetical protein n=1 Tax=Tenacibaculum aquimarinum TaxID=2910675 RepID=UPI001F0AADF0|nr:hypothetical protein [Tenacibaculum aquimarinum]MCH3883223.1 hypothetical protein [Tenacibaculum aquimarinum]
MENNSGFNPIDKFVSQVRINTQSELIEITEDKLENILLKHLSKLNKIKGWLTPVSLLLTILIVLLTAEFKLFWGVEKEVWKAIFILGLVATIIWSIITIINAIKCSKSSTVTFLINEIKNKN